jgi:hypothetical protein
MQNKNVQDEEKYGYSDIVDEMSGNYRLLQYRSYRCRGSRLIQYEVRKKEMFELKKAPGILQKKNFKDDD